MRILLKKFHLKKCKLIDTNYYYISEGEFVSIVGETGSGKIRGEGTHEELIERCSYYDELYQNNNHNKN